MRAKGGGVGGRRGGAYLIEWPWGSAYSRKYVITKAIATRDAGKESLLMSIYFFVTFNSKAFHSTKHAYELRFLRVLI